MKTLDPATTALVLIDLQNGILAMDLAPYPANLVVERSKDLAARFRAAGSPVVLVHVRFGEGERPSAEADKPMAAPAGGFPADWSDLTAGLRERGDIVVLKHHWGAFIGTDLDLQLRRRGVTTIVLAGVATNFGVESTARSAWELGYNVVIAEDACTSRSEALHRFAIDNILPAIAHVIASDDVTLRQE